MTLEPPIQATAMDHSPTHGAGLVSLVGAGPGDTGLLTVRGRDRLRDAEIVVYDRLVDPRLIDEAPPTAERVYVGKEAHHHLLRQDAINALLVEQGRLGKRVVRLKGGDPFLFGRGGEEAAALADAGVPFEVVPGVTSALAVPAYAGIPVTHRDVASSVTIVSGHHDPARGDAGRNWGALAAAETLVFLMGVADLPRIAAQLVAHGRPVGTPAAAIAWGTWAAQRTVVGTLGTLPDLVAEAGLAAPATVVVGAVVGLRERLRWFDDPTRKPLSGCRVLVARSRAQQSKLSAMLAALGACPVELPQFRFAEPDDEQPFGAVFARLSTYQYLVFTSGHGVMRFLDRLRADGRDVRSLAAMHLVAIGRGAQEALERRGLIADLVPDSLGVEAILACVAATGPAGKRLLLVAAAGTSAALERGLVGLGAAVDRLAPYRTEQLPPDPETLTALTTGGFDIIAFTSSSTVSNILALVSPGERHAPDGVAATVPTAWAPFGGTLVACIGPGTARTAREHGLRVDLVAEEHSMPGMVASILRWSRGAEQLAQDDRARRLGRELARAEEAAEPSHTSQDREGQQW